MRQPGAADKSQSATEVGLGASLAFARMLAWRCALSSRLQLPQVLRPLKYFYALIVHCCGQQHVFFL